MALTKDQFAEQLRHHRLLQGLNQSDVAHRVGVELRTYQRWEAAERMPYNRHIVALAQALDVDVEVFTGTLNTSDVLLRLEAGLAENNRLLRQLYGFLMAGSTVRAADASPAPPGELGQALDGTGQGLRDSPPTRESHPRTRRRAG